MPTSISERPVTVSRRGAERLAGGHPWIYRSDVEKGPGPGQEADVVVLKDGRGRFLAKAYWSTRSKIALRTISRDDVAIDEAFFAERIASALALRQSIYPDERSMRLVHGEADLLPGLVVDRYEDVLVLETLVPATERRKELFADVLASALAPRSILERNDVRVR